MKDIFLTCQWKNLAIVNYEVDPSLLLPFVPAGTELDSFQGKMLVTILGFQYEHARLKGISVPGHASFSEINLRFYVKRKLGGHQRRGVCFIKELVSLPAVSLIANICYSESFQTVLVDSIVEQKALGIYAQYCIKQKDKISNIDMMTLGPWKDVESGSIQEFILDHCFAYSSARNGRVMEYFIERPAWRYQNVSFVSVDINAKSLYGCVFSSILKQSPHSAFFVDGSNICVSHPRRLNYSPHYAILIFDGICYLCNGFVDFIIKHDKRKSFLLLPSQDKKARDILRVFDLEEKSDTSVFLVQGGRIYKESTAALLILQKMGFPFNLFMVLIIIPPFIRNAFYRLIALNRYRWFGRRQTCRFLPTEEQQKGEINES